MRLFRGRTDVYPMRWESKKTGKSGYSPVCLNEWRAGVCDKQRVKCADCSSRLLRPLTEVIVYEHLAGKHTIGVYPLLSDDTCHFLAVDFDEADWREDARAFIPDDPLEPRCSVGAQFIARLLDHTIAR